MAVGLGVVLGGTAGDRVGSGLAPPVKRGDQPPAAPDAPPGFVRFRDPEGRFSIAYPGDWTRVATRAGDVELLATRGRSASLLVRSLPLRFRVDRRNLGAVKGLTDRIVASGGRVRLLAQSRRIELGGLPGYFYFYSFRDPETGQRGTHSHYFLFRDATMVTFVLQALPEADFERFAPVFDRVASSFRAGG